MFGSYLLFVDVLEKDREILALIILFPLGNNQRHFAGLVHEQNGAWKLQQKRSLCPGYGRAAHACFFINSSRQPSAQK